MALTLQVNPLDPEDRHLVLAAEVVQAGGVVVYPTETLYGLGANALHTGAIRRVREIKQREGRKPILVIVPTIQAAEQLAIDLRPKARLLMERFWPGPLTLVLRASAAVPEELTQGTHTIGIRVPSSPLCLKLLRLCDCPMTSTSANLSGEPPALEIDPIRRALAPGVDLYLDGGKLPSTLPSTVVDTTGPHLRVLRDGAVPVSSLKAVVPEILF
jgi:L-threonylcarbamoyladenylate synthase